MWQKIIDRLFTVKSLVTIILTIAFVVLILKGEEIPQSFTTVYVAIITFYFGAQIMKS